MVQVISKVQEQGTVDDFIGIGSGCSKKLRMK